MEKRYSIMVLPRRPNGDILLQSWEDEGTTTTDGFGTFYKPNDSPRQIAQRKVLEKFKIKANLSETAKLQYFIDKPTGHVDLQVIIYFADITEEPVLQEQMHWFAPNAVPYSQMHAATGKWLPIILHKQGLLRATVKVSQPGDHRVGKVTDFTID